MRDGAAGRLKRAEVVRPRTSAAAPVAIAVDVQRRRDTCQT